MTGCDNRIDASELSEGNKDGVQMTEPLFRRAKRDDLQEGDLPSVSWPMTFNAERWVYLDADEHDFVVDCLFKFSFNVASFDSFLERIGDCAYRRVLLKWREYARRLRDAGAPELAQQGWIEAISTAWSQFLRIEIQQPYAVKGEKFAPGRKKGSFGRLRTIVEMAAEQAGSSEFDVVLAVLHEWASSGKNGVDEIDEDGQKIWIRGVEQPRSIKTIRNYLAQP